MNGLEFKHIEIGQLLPNGYNKNKMRPRVFEAEIESIASFGFVDPVTVRFSEGSAVIVDGEHRVKAVLAMSEALAGTDCTSIVLGDRRVSLCQRAIEMFKATPVMVPCVVIDVSEGAARRLTIVLNETRGQLAPSDLYAMLKVQQADFGLDPLLGVGIDDRDWNILQAAYATDQSEISAALDADLKMVMENKGAKKASYHIEGSKDDVDWIKKSVRDAAIAGKFTDEERSTLTSLTNESDVARFVISTALRRLL